MSALGRATLRPAKEADEGWLWHLANDPAVRLGSLSTAPIPRGEHQSWMAHLLRSEAVHRILELQGVPVGWARVEPSGGGGRVSVALFPGARRRGWGTPLIRVVTTLACDRGWSPITAEIRPENVGSRRAFVAAGYHLHGEADGPYRVLYRAG